MVDGIQRFFRVFIFNALAGEVVWVEQYFPAGDADYDSYQKYYETSLRERVRFVQNSSQSRFAPNTTHVGQYLFHMRRGGVHKVAIDAHDHRNIRSQAIYDWCDIYFKSNFWPSMEYGHKVLPIPTGNPRTTLENYRFLRGLRSAEKEWDFVFLARIWPGGDANVEHNLRLFESLAKINCKSRLMAVVFCFDKESLDYQNISQRLHAAGVEWIDQTFGYGELMALSATSKLVVIRAGISGCISWRMVDMLAIGACVVLDRPPFPAWPVPLTEGVNFLSLDLAITEDCRPAPKNQYDEVQNKISNYLSESSLQTAIAHQNAHYFDKYIHNLRLLDYLVESISNHSSLARR